MVIDVDSGKALGDIPGQKNAHGVALVPSLGRGFITDGGGEGAIVIFELKTYAVLGKLVTLPDSDGSSMTLHSDAFWRSQETRVC